MILVLSRRALLQNCAILALRSCCSPIQTLEIQSFTLTHCDYFPLQCCCSRIQTSNPVFGSDEAQPISFGWNILVSRQTTVTTKSRTMNILETGLCLIFVNVWQWASIVVVILVARDVIGCLWKFNISRYSQHSMKFKITKFQWLDGKDKRLLTAGCKSNLKNYLVNLSKWQSQCWETKLPKNFKPLCLSHLLWYIFDEKFTIQFTNSVGQYCSLPPLRCILSNWQIKVIKLCQDKGFWDWEQKLKRQRSMLVEPPGKKC